MCVCKGKRNGCMCMHACVYACMCVKVTRMGVNTRRMRMSMCVCTYVRVRIYVCKGDKNGDEH